jgi:hypothetical protein
MFALAPSNDPFYISPQRQKDAEWFHRFWIDLGLTRGAHIRRVHYRVVSFAGTVMADGRPYENTELCWHYICNAGRDARYLGLVPAEFIVDHRNPDPLIYLADEPEVPPEIGVGPLGVLETEFDSSRPELMIPSLSLDTPAINQRYVVEIATRLVDGATGGAAFGVSRLPGLKSHFKSNGLPLFLQNNNVATVVSEQCGGENLQVKGVRPELPANEAKEVDTKKTSHSIRYRC